MVINDLNSINVMRDNVLSFKKCHYQYKDQVANKQHKKTTTKNTLASMIQSNISMHYYECVALCFVNILQ